jgi:tRNA-2-methylthio-N6-dimethylallyladenosine synthase
MQFSAYIKTYGCQMNEHDSFRMMDILRDAGWAIADTPEAADLILLNTCSVRHNPENKVFSELGRLRPLKKRRPDLIIGVAGCVAQQCGETILKREAAADMVFGPDHFFRLPEFIGRVRAGERVCETDQPKRPAKVGNFVPEAWIDRGHVEGIRAYIAIMKGCNNFCSFCIVPYTRGREVSRERENIVREARGLVRDGAKEIWLLGQNVNSWADGDSGFYHLLDTVSQIEGLQRLRFTSPHPRGWTDDLADLMAARKTICNHVHLPFQAGSDRVLKAMRRRHTIEEYLKKVRYLRCAVPGVEITTDVIAGFPGEREADFRATLRVLEEVRFSQVFSFKYSVRPGTAAADREDDVPRKEKEARLARLIAVQDRINRETQAALTGTVQEVLIDGAHPRERDVMNGRTDGYRAISVRDESLRIGDCVRARVTGWSGHWLHGETIKKDEKA